MTFTLYGKLYQKGNSRRNVTNRRTGKPMSIKSQNALDCTESFKAQAIQQWKGKPLEGRIRLIATVYYQSRRPDLCTSLLKDLLQKICYKDDRQVVECHEYKELDKDNPRVVVEVKEI